MIKTAALAGGVGGAKLVDGLAEVLSPDQLTVVVNTGDDFELYGLHLSPDLDTVCYTLAGIANPETGWGRAEETWHCLEELQALGGPAWFKLGDRDLATHLERTRKLRSGVPLSEVTRDFCRAWGVRPRVLPMSDDPVPTQVITETGVLAFQEYFVRDGCQPAVRGFEFSGSDRALPAPGVLDALRQADLIVICPSNPWVSIDPILSVGSIRELLVRKPVVAVTPLIGGKAVKGPAAKMYQEMGLTPSARAVAAHYQDLLNGFVLDEEDRELEGEIAGLSREGIRVLTENTWMKSRADRIELARAVLAFGKELV